MAQTVKFKTKSGKTVSFKSTGARTRARKQGKKYVTSWNRRVSNCMDKAQQRGVVGRKAQFKYAVRCAKN